MPPECQVPVARSQRLGVRTVLALADERQKAPVKGVPAGAELATVHSPVIGDVCKQPRNSDSVSQANCPTERTLDAGERPGNGGETHQHDARDPAREARNSGRYGQVTNRRTRPNPPLPSFCLLPESNHRRRAARRCLAAGDADRRRPDLIDQPQTEGRHALGERRRRSAVGRAVLEAVPGAGDAAVEGLSLAGRSGAGRRSTPPRACGHGKSRAPLQPADRDDARAAIADLADAGRLDEAVGTGPGDLLVERPPLLAAARWRATRVTRPAPRRSAGNALVASCSTPSATCPTSSA